MRGAGREYDFVAQNGFVLWRQVLGTSACNGNSWCGRARRKAHSQFTVSVLTRDRSAEEIVAVGAVGICLPKKRCDLRFKLQPWRTTFTGMWVKGHAA